MSPSPTLSCRGDSTRLGDSMSSSVTVTVSVSDSGPKPPPTELWVTVTVSSAVSSSSTPVTVTVRGWFQFKFVNTKLVGTANAPMSLDNSATVTAPVGSVAKRSVYVAVSPSSTLNCWGENT